MASKGSSSSDIPVLLRVKRKRTEEPLEALIVASKLQKLDEFDGRSKKSEGGGNVFHFAGTVQTQGESPNEILSRVSRQKNHSALVKLGPFSKLTISDHQEEQREKRKSLSDQRRFKLISQHRCLEEDKENHQKQPEEKEDQQTTSLQISNRDGEAARKDGGKEMVCLYDLEEEEGDGGAGAMLCDDLSGRGGSHDVAEGGGVGGCSAITCNSSPMSRQRVPAAESEFVYDVYFTHTRNMADPSHYNWSHISAYSYDQDLVHASQHLEEECCDDEDDSNDEDNWRNDYPDEVSDEEDSDVASLDQGYRGKDSYRGENEEDSFLDGNYWDNRD